MRHIKFFENFGNPPVADQIKDAKMVVISHLGEVETSPSKVDWAALYRLEESPTEEDKKACLEHLAQECPGLSCLINIEAKTCLVMERSRNVLEGLGKLNPIQVDDKIFYVDENGVWLFYYYPNKKNDFVYLNYERIWMFFSKVLILKSSEIESIIKNWLEETYNLRGLTPFSSSIISSISWKRPII